MSKLFAIGLEVEEVAVGRVLRLLDAMAGVAKINLNLTGQRRGEIADENEADNLDQPIQRVGPPKLPVGVDPLRGRCDQAIADALKDTELHIKELSALIERRGFSPTSLSSMLNRMYKDGRIKRAAYGVWKLSPAGVKHFFKGQANAPSTAKKIRNGPVRPPNNTRGARRVVLEFLRDGPRATREVTKELVDKGMSAKNMTGTVYKMRIDYPKLIVLKNGMYSLTPEGVAAIDEINRDEQPPQSQAAE